MLKNRKITISRPRLERFRQNLARLRSSTLLTVPTFKNFKFWKSKMAAADILNNRIKHLLETFFPANHLAKYWKTKTNTTKQTYNHNKIYYNINEPRKKVWSPPTTSDLKRRGPILVSALHKFVTYLPTYLDTYPLTYSPGTHTLIESTVTMIDVWRTSFWRSWPRSPRSRWRHADSACPSVDCTPTWTWYEARGNMALPCTSASRSHLRSLITTVLHVIIWTFPVFHGFLLAYLHVLTKATYKYSAFDVYGGILSEYNLKIFTRYTYSITARWKFCSRFINSRLNAQYLPSYRLIC